MKIANIDTSKEVMVIAEIGNNHEGNFDVARKMIDAAAATGVHAVKFQTFISEYYVGISNPERFERLKSFELSFSEFEALSKHCEDRNVIFLSTPFDLESAKFLADVVPAYKISSSDNTFYPLLETIAKTSKPILLSAGLVGKKQLSVSKKFIEDIWTENNINSTLAILHCVTSYPVERKEANLGAISDLINNFNCTIGYSDHTIGIDAAFLSVALGARIIEKHFTLDHNYSDFRDHQISAEPGEMKELVDKIKLATELIGSGIKLPQESERSIEQLVRRSIVSKKNLSVGKKIELDDLIWTRPGGGLAPGLENKVIGKTVANFINAGQIIKEVDLI